MTKKRLVIDLDEADHKNLTQSARALDLTASNYVRQAVGLPVQEQGVKAPAPKRHPKKKIAGKKPIAAKKQAVHKKKSAAAKK
jgi:hypothetical protein